MRCSNKITYKLSTHHGANTYIQHTPHTHVKLTKELQKEISKDPASHRFSGNLYDKGTAATGDARTASTKLIFPLQLRPPSAPDLPVNLHPLHPSTGLCWASDSALLHTMNCCCEDYLSNWISFVLPVMEGFQIGFSREGVQLRAVDSSRREGIREQACCGHVMRFNTQEGTIFEGLYITTIMMM